LGLILDTSVLIASERRGGSIDVILEQALALHGETEIGLSAVSVVELTHGIYRAKSDSDRDRRRVFSRKAFHDPLTLEIAELPGKIEGEQAARGNTIAVEDLEIGVTALYLGFDVVTLNRRHFESIPGLKVLTF